MYHGVGATAVPVGRRRGMGEYFAPAAGIGAFDPGNQYDVRLANAINSWAGSPDSLARRQTVVGRAMQWASHPLNRKAMRGVGEYFAPAAGIGADAVVPAEASIEGARGSLMLGIGGGVAVGFLLGYMFKK